MDLRKKKHNFHIHHKHYKSQYMGSSVADISTPGKTQWIISDWCSFIDHVQMGLDVPRDGGSSELP